MQVDAQKRAIAKKLQASINMMQGLGKLSGMPAKPGLALFAEAFPEEVFPTGTVHEFVSDEIPAAAATNGFITALAGKVMQNSGLCLWISNEKNIYPSGLNHFGLDADRIVFIHAPKPKDALWIVEEALKCEALASVIAQVKELGFTESRRLQLAVEKSGVTGFIHRSGLKYESSTACTARWKITPLPSVNDDLPGIGLSCWNVELLKVRNGKPRAWQVSWREGHFALPSEDFSIQSLPQRHAG